MHTSHPAAEWVRIGPKEAAELLETKAPNRRVSQHKVDQYAAEMRQQKWSRNGETIKFDTEGRLIDGQHRLWALVESGTEQWFLIVRGVEAEAMSTIDIGKKRNMADFLSFQGIHADNQALSAAARMVWQYDELHEIVQREGFHAATNMGKSLMHMIGLRASALAAGLFLTRSRNAEAAAEYEEGLRTGIGLREGDPRIALRRYGMNRRKKSGGGEIARMHLFAYIRAWNAWVKGSSVQIIHVRAEDGQPEILAPEECSSVSPHGNKCFLVKGHDGKHEIQHMLGDEVWDNDGNTRHYPGIARKGKHGSR